MSGPWEDYQTKAERPKPPAAKPAGPWDDYAAAPTSKVAAVKELPQVTGLDRTRAAAAGVNRGLFNDLLGLPVDTAANLVDLAKIAVGGGYTGIKSAITGKMEVPPEWSEPSDRSKIVGSSEWLNRKTNDIGMGAAVNNPAPQDAASRILHTGGRYAGASVVPSSRIPLGVGVQATNAGMGAVSGLISGGVAEVAPECAGLAGMAPSLGVHMGANGIKLAARGGEAGRQAMNQRMQDLKAGGVDSPSVGLATGRPTIMGLENLLAQTPFSGGLYGKAGQANIAGMKAKTDSVRDAISSEYGPVVAGQAVQGDIKGAFRDRTKATAGRLADKVADIVGRESIVPVSASMDKARQLSTPTKGAEATSGSLIQPRIARIADNLETDVFGPRLDPQRLNVADPTRNLPLSPKVPQVPVNNSGLLNIPIEPGNPLPQVAQRVQPRQPVIMDTLTNLPKKAVSQPPLPQRDGPNPTLNLPLSRAIPQQTVANSSLWNKPIAPIGSLPQRNGLPSGPGRPGDSLMNSRKPQGIPFGALKSLRTSIGEETQSNAIMGTPEQAQFKQLYGAMSQDMRQAASSADRARAGVDVGPLTSSQQPAGVALTRANKHFSTAMNRADELNGIANRSTPEGAYGAVEQSLRSGPTTWERTRSAVTPATRQKVAATMIDEMGTATPGQQTAAGDAWSPRTFLTNYNKLYQNGGGQALFTRLPGGKTHAENLASIAKAADMVGSASKVWANPSGTAPALTARGTLYTLTAGAFIQPMLAASTAAGLVGARQVSQRLLLNPKFVAWLAKSPNVPPAQARAHAQRLMGLATVSRDPQFKQDASDYLDLVEQGQQQ